MQTISFLQGYEDCYSFHTYNSPGYVAADYAEGWDAALDDMLTYQEDMARGDAFQAVDW